MMRAIPILLAFTLVSSALADQAGDGNQIETTIQSYYRDRPAADATVQTLLKIMEESPEDPGVPAALAFLIRHGGVSTGTDYDMDKEFLGRIEKHHVDNDSLAGALLSMHGFREPETIAFFEKLIAKSKSPVVVSAASIALASSYEYDSKAAGRYDGILENLIAKHPDVKYGNRDLTGYAQQKLFASKNLRIGKTAPEVEGEDAEGKQFKLSDYRGKVVFFNFWGDW